MISTFLLRIIIEIIEKKKKKPDNLQNTSLSPIFLRDLLCAFVSFVREFGSKFSKNGRFDRINVKLLKYSKS